MNIHVDRYQQLVKLNRLGCEFHQPIPEDSPSCRDVHTFSINPSASIPLKLKFCVYPSPAWPSRWHYCELSLECPALKVRLTASYTFPSCGFGEACGREWPHRDVSYIRRGCGKLKDAHS
jgi:hypothetical protein